MIVHLVFVFSQMLWAQSSNTEVGSGSPVSLISASSNPEHLPKCVSDPRQVQAIHDYVYANRSNEFKYQKYKDAFQSDSDTQLVARLAYAETLAATCPEKEKQMAPMIVSAIMNRVRKKQGNVAAVVYKHNQFASSLNTYDQSRYKDFLCPKDSKLWNLVYAQAQQQIAALPQQVGSFSADTTMYFLYKNRPGDTKAPWSFPEDTTHTNPQLQSCIRFFVNPSP